eukprot:Lithocolla_globosa_v1_NODE_3605_length_1624_cov_55.790312.p3 type:complete len:116 gc:universal NODE_3605_length_1624_cov_55.790312:464-811(+)
MSGSVWLYPLKSLHHALTNGINSAPRILASSSSSQGPRMVASCHKKAYVILIAVAIPRVKRATLVGKRGLTPCSSRVEINSGSNSFKMNSLSSLPINNGTRRAVNAEASSVSATT